MANPDAHVKNDVVDKLWNMKDIADQRFRNNQNVKNAVNSANLTFIILDIDNYSEDLIQRMFNRLIDIKDFDTFINTLDLFFIQDAHYEVNIE